MEPIAFGGAKPVATPKNSYSKENRLEVNKFNERIYGTAIVEENGKRNKFVWDGNGWI